MTQRIPSTDVVGSQVSLAVLMEPEMGMERRFQHRGKPTFSENSLDLICPLYN